MFEGHAVGQPSKRKHTGVRLHVVAPPHVDSLGRSGSSFVRAAPDLDGSWNFDAVGTL